MHADDWFLLTFLAGLVAVGVAIEKSLPSGYGPWPVLVLCVGLGLLFRHLSRA